MLQENNYFGTFNLCLYYFRQEKVFISLEGETLSLTLS